MYICMNEWFNFQIAYEVLMDDEKRNIYNSFGKEGLKNRQEHRGHPFPFFNK